MCQMVTYKTVKIKDEWLINMCQMVTYKTVKIKDKHLFIVKSCDHYKSQIRICFIGTPKLLCHVSKAFPLLKCYV